jgi:hypothetical protein
MNNQQQEMETDESEFTCDGKLFTSIFWQAYGFIIII